MGDTALAHSHAVRQVMRMLAALVAAEQMPNHLQVSDSIGRAARAIGAAARGEECSFARFDESAGAAGSLSGYAIFAGNGAVGLSDESFADACRALIAPAGDAAIETIVFQTMPMWWLGCVYQGLLAYRPDRSGGKLELNQSYRKGAGIFFTPACLVDYVTESVLGPLADDALGKLDSDSPVERLLDLKILDPAMGGGDFLSASVGFLGGAVGGDTGRTRAEVAANCVYGVDIDPIAVEIARFGVWAASGYAEGISERINSHLVCADALGAGGGVGAFGWGNAFPEVFGNGRDGGFDAVVGNPPYVAAKNGLSSEQIRGTVRGQSDSYLMFLSSALDNNLVRSGGMLAMVLPDPMLVRENAAEVRRRLVTDWTIVSLLHIYGAFPGAVVANIIPICRNAKGGGSVFWASRIEYVPDRRSFVLRPRTTAEQLSHPVRRDTVVAQERCEFLYLLEVGAYAGTIRRIHGEDVCLSRYVPPFAPLGELNVKAIYRGEEVGKSAIRGETGDLPMLLGGQSIRPYEITWEGRRTDRSRIRKPVERYLSTKILVQKSSARLVAALDRVDGAQPGYVFPQSVYAIELTDKGMSELYLLCVLNSEVMNEYIRRTVTGYKMLQPQLELEDIRRLPIRRISFSTHHAERHDEAAVGMRLFEDESLRLGAGGAFSGLANFVVSCLTGVPERSDVVHDILAHLGEIVVRLTASSREAPDSATTRRLEAARAAIEVIVWRLYSSEPAQMSLPW